MYKIFRSVCVTALLSGVLMPINNLIAMDLPSNRPTTMQELVKLSRAKCANQKPKLVIPQEVQHIINDVSFQNICEDLVLFEHKSKPMYAAELIRDFVQAQLDDIPQAEKNDILNNRAMVLDIVIRACVKLCFNEDRLMLDLLRMYAA